MKGEKQIGKKKFSAEFKAKVALTAIKEEETTSQIASRFGVHPSQVRLWKTEFLKNASLVFEKNKKEEEKFKKQLDSLYKKIGQVTVERDFSLRKFGLL